MSSWAVALCVTSARAGAARLDPDERWLVVAAVTETSAGTTSAERDADSAGVVGGNAPSAALKTRLVAAGFFEAVRLVARLAVGSWASAAVAPSDETGRWALDSAAAEASDGEAADTSVAGAVLAALAVGAVLTGAPAALDADLFVVVAGASSTAAALGAAGAS